MFELHQVGERTYYIDCPAKIGLYRATDTGVYCIDSGGDKDAGRKIRKLLDENGWELKGIINTHSNADHIGGNQYLQRQTGCPIFAKGMEAAFTRFPILEPSFLYGGYPCKPLRHKFLLAAESEVREISDDTFPKELEVIPLPGHFFDMIGIRTPDDVVFLADCISSRETLDKYWITFLYDLDAYLQTLDAVEAMEAKLFIPAHAAATAEIRPLVQHNRKKIFEIIDHITALLETPMCFEQLLQALFHKFGRTMNFEQYVLVGSTVRSYLSYLLDHGKLETDFTENMLRWRAFDRKERRNGV